MPARSKVRHPSPPKQPPRARANRLTRIVLPGLLAVGVALVALLWVRTWIDAGYENGDATGDVEPPTLPELSKSRYFEAMQAAQYVGTKACAECHADEHASYLHTGHSRSFGPVDLASEPPDGGFSRQDPAWRYASYRENGHLRHREFLATPGGEVTLVDRPLKYLVGSGRFSRTYLAEVDGILVESPLTWYASLNAWSHSPGFQKGPYNSFCRNISAGCLYCHVGQAEFPPHDDHRGQILEMPIGCERCHGPGSVHVAQRRRGKPPPAGDDLTIIHPSKLPRELSEAICHQCHLESDSFADVRNRRREDFRPGLRWTDFVVNYARQVDDQGMTVTGHVQQMHLSRCYTQSETLTCITCHDPHHTPAPQERREHYRAACLECHTDASCREPLARRSSTNGNDCAACHMPQSATDIVHVAFTHHRIGIHGKAMLAAPEEGPGQLAPILDVSHLPEADRERLLGLAYARQIGRHEQDDRYQTLWLPAEEHLKNAALLGLSDPALRTALAVVARRRSDNPAARELAEAVLADDATSADDRAVAIKLLAGLDLEVGRLPEAHRHLQQLTELRLMPGDWFLLGNCRQRMGDLPGAIAAYEKVLQIDATEPGTYRVLAEIYEGQGKAERAKELRERAALIEEHLARLAN